MVYIKKTHAFISRLEKYKLAGQKYRDIYLFSSSSGFVVGPGPIIWLDYINWFHLEQTKNLVSYSVFNFCSQIRSGKIVFLGKIVFSINEHCQIVFLALQEYSS